MLNYERILDAAGALLRGRFPEAEVYRDRTPKDFARPSFLIALEEFTMTDANALLVEQQCVLAVTGFPPVDGYGNAQTADLLTLLAATEELFAGNGLRVEGETAQDARVLHVGQIKGDYQADYAGVRVPLTWMDERPKAGRDWPIMGDVTVRIKEKEE